MKQVIGGRKVSPLRGILIIALIFVIFIVLVVGLLLLEMTTSFRHGKVALWAIGIAAALYMMFFYVRSFEYELDSFELRISRRYGNRVRLMAGVITRNMRFAGSREEAKKRFPKTREYRACHRTCPYERFTVVYDTDGETRMVTLQPEPALREAILRAMKEDGRGK